MKKLFANFKDLTKRHKKLVIFFVVIAFFAIGIQMFRTFSARRPKDTEITTPSITTSEASTEVTTATTSVPSAEDISAMVSEAVESQVAERLAKMDSTPAVTQVPETTTAKTATIKVEEEPTIEEGNVDDDAITENGSITIFQGNGSYTVSCKSDLYEAAFYATYPPVDGRDLLIQLPDDAISISIAYSIRNTDKNLLELSDFEELVLEQTENGIEAQYSIPDNPLQSDGLWPFECPSFYGVFRLETTDGFEYFSISY